MKPETIQQLIEEGMPDADVYVEGDGAHFQALIVSDAFIGQSRIARQQIVYTTVKSQLLDGSLHALSLKTYTKEEWEAMDNDATGKP